MSSRYVFATIALSITVCVLGVGVVMMPELRRRQGVEQCIAAFATRDARVDARRDHRSGETRFFFTSHNGYVGYLSADGVPVSPRFVEPSFGCQPKPTASFRASLYPQYSNYRVMPGRHCCDYDPPRTGCGKAHDQYLRAYNAEMARISPASVKNYCH